MRRITRFGRVVVGGSSMVVVVGAHLVARYPALWYCLEQSDDRR